MKKMFRIALCALLTLALVFSFTACSDDAPKNNAVEEEKDNKALAEEAVKGFMDGFRELDIEAMSGYCLDGEAFKESLGFESVEDAITEGIVQSGANEEMVNLMAPYVESVVDVMKHRVNYEILSIEEDGEDYIATVAYTVPDYETAMATLQANYGEEESQALGEEIAMELLENGTITQDSTQEEIAAALIDSMMDRLLSELETIIIETEPVEDEVEISVIEKDGKWYVDEETAGFVKEVLN